VRYTAQMLDKSHRDHIVALVADLERVTDMADVAALISGRTPVPTGH